MQLNHELFYVKLQIMKHSFIIYIFVTGVYIFLFEKGGGQKYEFQI